jgi:hypothetical protein
MVARARCVLGELFAAVAIDERHDLPVDDVNRFLESVKRISEVGRDCESSRFSKPRKKCRAHGVGRNGGVNRLSRSVTLVAFRSMIFTATVVPSSFRFLSVEREELAVYTC